jgi:pyruvate, water dikinase
MNTHTLERVNRAAAKAEDLIRAFKDVRRAHVAIVGGKNASLGEMSGTLQGAGIRVPDGFATTAAAYWLLLEANDLTGRLTHKLAELQDDLGNLATVGKAVRQMILEAELPPVLADAITDAYRGLARKSGRTRLSVAVRSSATAEDLPEASFAGQLETYLNVCGEEALLAACKRCYASLFTDRAIVYRRNHGFDQ